MYQIRALTFDLDDTLWDNRPVLLSAERTLYDWLVEHYPKVGDCYSFIRFRQMRLELAERDINLRHHMTELRRASLRLVADQTGYDHGLVEPAMEVFLEARHRILLYDDVIPALRRLRQAGFRLGSLTNGNADVHRLGIGELFDFSLSADSVGQPKPHPLMFQTAFRHAGVSPAQLAHVGDEPVTDLEGAQAAGAKAIWMNRQQLVLDPGIRVDAHVSDMTELLGLFGLGTLD